MSMSSAKDRDKSVGPDTRPGSKCQQRADSGLSTGSPRRQLPHWATGVHLVCMGSDAQCSGTAVTTGERRVPELVWGVRPGARRALVRPHEAAHVMQVSLREVRNQLRRRGRIAGLTPVHCGRRILIDPDEVAERLCGNQLALEVLAAVVDGRYAVPRPRSETEQPTSLILSAGAI
jgi:hypothetical protein